MPLGLKLATKQYKLARSSGFNSGCCSGAFEAIFDVPCSHDIKGVLEWPRGDTRGKLHIHNFNTRYEIARVRNLFPSSPDSATPATTEAPEVTTIPPSFVPDPPDVHSPIQQANTGRLKAVEALEKAAKAAFYSCIQNRVTTTDKRIASAFESLKVSSMSRSFIEEQELRRATARQVAIDRNTHLQQRNIANNISGSQSPDPTQDIGFTTAGIVHSRPQRDQIAAKFTKMQQKKQQPQTLQSQTRESDLSSSLPQPMT